MDFRKKVPVKPPTQEGINDYQARKRTDPRKPMPKGYVYFVQGEDGGRIKIGHAVDVESRMKKLQTGSPLLLKVLAVIPARINTERSLHRRFKHLRTRGEWFEPGDDLVEFIDDITQLDREIDAL